MSVLSAKQNIERAKGAAEERRAIAREIRTYVKEWRMTDSDVAGAMTSLLRFVLRRSKD